MVGGVANSTGGNDTGPSRIHSFAPSTAGRVRRGGRPRVRRRRTRRSRVPRPSPVNGATRGRSSGRRGTTIGALPARRRRGSGVPGRGGDRSGRRPSSSPPLSPPRKSRRFWFRHPPSHIIGERPVKSLARESALTVRWARLDSRWGMRRRPDSPDRTMVRDTRSNMTVHRFPMDVKKECGRDNGSRERAGDHRADPPGAPMAGDLGRGSSWWQPCSSRRYGSCSRSCRGTGDDPIALLSSGAAIRATNVIAFALWYWEFDRGGPYARVHDSSPATRTPDFAFPQTPVIARAIGLFT